jgi:hypothetical protein
MSQEFNPNEPSQGLGDSIARVTHVLGIDKVAEGVARAMGKEDCGCNKRRQALNNIFPYASKTPPSIVTPVTAESYTFEGTRQFRVLASFAAKVSDVDYKFNPGDIVDITSGTGLYQHLKNLLEHHTLEVHSN